jgi:Skp family chaperone for outer membrane proteins
MRNSRNFLVSATALLILSMAFVCGGKDATASAAEKRSLSIAHVDIDRIFNEYTKAKDLGEQLQKEILKPGEDLINRLTREASAKKRDLSKMNPNTNQLEFFKGKQELEYRIAQIKATKKEIVAKMQARKLEGLTEIMKDLNQAVAKYAKNNGIDLVLRQQRGDSLPPPKSVATFNRMITAQTILYSAAALDITDAVLKDLNRTYERGSTTPKG